MSNLNKLHIRAMDLAEAAMVARVRGEENIASDLFRQALVFEREAANKCADDLSFEPTRSVLYRSAASIAMQCGETREAEKLIATALAGNPPDEIADELRDLLEDVHFQRHLKLKGLSLDPQELQFSIAGKCVGFGIAPSEEYVERIQAFSKIVSRTVERKMGIPYRERGGTEKAVRERAEVFVSAARSQSLAVTMKVGRVRQQLMLDFEKELKSEEIIDEICYCLETLNSGNNEKLEEHIDNNAYYKNFVALARKIAPDGEDVKVVGFTVMRHGKRRDIPITKTTRELGAPRKRRISRPARFTLQSMTEHLDEADDQLIEVRGKLKFADSTGGETGTIKVVDSDDIEHVVIVPEGMMSDIVKPLWDIDVIICGRKTETGIELEDIDKATRRSIGR